MKDYNEVITEFQYVPGGLIEAYHAVQREYNYIPEEAIIAAAKVFGLSVAEAYGVATFYSYLKVGPRGKYVIRICESSPCHIAGAAEVVKALEEELGIKMGETTSDGIFTLEFTECVGQCQATPVITINGKPFVDISAADVATVLLSYK